VFEEVRGFKYLEKIIKQTQTLKLALWFWIWQP